MVSLKKLANGFEYLEVVNLSASAKIALQGGHIFDYTPTDKEPLLWLSEASNFKYGESIRGGIPICWPWFGMHTTDTTLPQHGFARTSLWTHTQTIEKKDATQITLKLQSSSKTKELFPYKFELTLIIDIGEKLQLQLITTNTDTKAFTITQALHTYFNISDTNHITIKGLKNKTYFDALDAHYKKQVKDIKINKEVDRVFQDTEKEIVLQDTNSKISISREGSSSVVIWNPWIDKCSRMSAMKEDSYKTFVCIESANALSDAREIESHTSHTLQTTINYI